MTGLLPTLREKRRYLVYEVMGATLADSAMAIKSTFAYLFGAVVAARAGITSIKSVKARGILSVPRNYLDELRAALAFTTHINKQPVIIRSIGASGTVKNATRYLTGA